MHRTEFGASSCNLIMTWSVTGEISCEQQTIPWWPCVSINTIDYLIFLIQAGLDTSIKQTDTVEGHTSD